MVTFRRLGKLGRFGNQLFQYAGTRLYAELNGFSSAFPTWDGVKLFPEVREWPLKKHVSALCLPTIQLEDMQSTSRRERILRPFGLWDRNSLDKLYLQPRDNISLYGYLQSDLAIAKLRENRAEVRKWYTFRKDINDAFRSATDTYHPWLAVHLRLGDMVERGMASNVNDAVAHVERLQGGRNLFIATDTPEVRERLKDRRPISPRNPLPELPPYIFDFWMLKEADVLIGSGSTFAWWAAFLSGRSEYWSPPLNRTWSKNTVPPIERQAL